MTKRWKMGILLLGLAIGGLPGCGSEEVREAHTEKLRLITPEQLLHLAENNTQPLRLRTTRDVLPGGLSAAMSPAIIDWQASEIDRPDGFVIVHNLNYGGNPLEGTTVLQTVKVPLDGVERVEWVLVPLSRGGRKALIHHGQLRFIFRPDRPVTLVNMSGDDSGGDAVLLDLVASWEAWRPPGMDYDVLVGMNADAYHLGMRLFAGPQRFLEDALGDRDWYVTPLRLPGGEAGPAELLKVTLAMGDGLARQTMFSLLKAHPDRWLAEAPTADAEKLVDQWHELMKLLQPHDKVKDPRLNLPPEDRTYQTVLRSCATMAYYNLIVAVDRLLENGHSEGVDRDRLDEARLGAEEPWMSELSSTNLGGLVMRAPAALRWLRSNPQAIPSRIPGRLNKAGLVRREKGRPVEIHYSKNGMTPYGRLDDNLIR